MLCQSYADVELTFTLVYISVYLHDAIRAWTVVVLVQVALWDLFLVVVLRDFVVLTQCESMSHSSVILVSSLRVLRARVGAEVVAERLELSRRDSLRPCGSPTTGWISRPE